MGEQLYFNQSAKRVGYAFNSSSDLTDFLSMHNPDSWDCIDEQSYFSLQDLLHPNREVVFLSVDRLLYKKDAQGDAVVADRSSIIPVSDMVPIPYTDYIKKNPMFRYEYGQVGESFGMIFREYRICEILQFGMFKQKYQIKSVNNNAPLGPSKLIFANVDQFKRGELRYDVVDCNAVTFRCPGNDSFIDSGGSPRTSFGSTSLGPVGNISVAVPSLKLPTFISNSSSSNSSNSSNSNNNSNNSNSSSNTNSKNNSNNNSNNNTPSSSSLKARSPSSSLKSDKPQKKPINSIAPVAAAITTTTTTTVAAVSKFSSIKSEVYDTSGRSHSQRVLYIDGPSNICNERFKSNTDLGGRGSRGGPPRAGSVAYGGGGAAGDKLYMIPSVDDKKMDSLSFDDAFKTYWAVSKDANKWKCYWGPEMVDRELYAVPHHNVSKGKGDFNAQVESLGIENLEYFHTKKAFLEHAIENPHIIRSWSRLWLMLEENGWSKQQVDPAEDPSYYEGGKGKNRQFYVYYSNVDKKDLVPGIHAFNNRLAAIQYLCRFPFLLQEDAQFCRTIERYRWVKKIDGSSKKGSTKYHIAQKPEPCYTINEIREQSWIDPWFLFQAYSEIGRDRILAAVKVPEEAALNVDVAAKELNTPESKTPLKKEKKEVRSHKNNKMAVVDVADDKDDDEEEEEEEEEEDENDEMAMVVAKPPKKIVPKRSKEDIEKERLATANKNILEAIDTYLNSYEMFDDGHFVSLLLETSWHVEFGTSSWTDEWWRHEKIFIPYWSSVNPTNIDKTSGGDDEVGDLRNGRDFFFGLSDIISYINMFGNKPLPKSRNKKLANIEMDYCSMELDDRLKEFSKLGDKEFDTLPFGKKLFHKYLELSGWQRIPLDQQRNIYIPHWRAGEVSRDNYLNHDMDLDWYNDVRKVVKYIKKNGNEPPKNNHSMMIIDTRLPPYERIKEILGRDPKKYHIYTFVWNELKELGWRCVYGKVKGIPSRVDVILPSWFPPSDEAVVDLTDSSYVQNIDYFLQNHDVLAYIRKHKTIDRVGEGASPAKLLGRRNNNCNSSSSSSYSTNVTFNVSEEATKSSGGKKLSEKSSSSNGQNSDSMDIAGEGGKKKSPGRPKSPNAAKTYPSNGYENKQLKSSEFNQTEDYTVNVSSSQDAQGRCGGGGNFIDPDVHRTDLTAEEKALRKEVLEIVHTKNPNFYPFPKIKEQLVILGWKMNVETTTGGTVTLPPWTDLENDGNKKRSKVVLGLWAHGRDYFNDSKDVTHYIQKHGLDSTNSAATPMERLSKKSQSYNIAVVANSTVAATTATATTTAIDATSSKVDGKVGGGHLLKRLNSTDNKDPYQVSTVPLEEVQISLRGNKYRSGDERLAVSSSPVSPAAAMRMAVADNDATNRSSIINNDNGSESAFGEDGEGEEEEDDETTSFVDELSKVSPDFEYIWDCLHEIGWSCESASKKNLAGLLPPPEVIDMVYYRVGTKERRLKNEEVILDEDYFYSQANLINYVRMQYGVVNSMVNEIDKPRTTRNNQDRNASQSIIANRNGLKIINQKVTGAKRGAEKEKENETDDNANLHNKDAAKKAKVVVSSAFRPLETFVAGPESTIRKTLHRCLESMRSSKNYILSGRESEIGEITSLLLAAQQQQHGIRSSGSTNKKCILIHGSTGLGKSASVDVAVGQVMFDLQNRGVDISGSYVKIICTAEPNPMTKIYEMLEPSVDVEHLADKSVCRARVVQRCLDLSRPPLIVVLDELDRCKLPVIRDILALTQVETHNIVVIGTSNTAAYVDQSITSHPALHMMPFAQYSKEQIKLIIDKQSRGLVDDKALTLLSAKCRKFDSDIRRVFDVLQQGFTFLLNTGNDLDVDVHPVLNISSLKHFANKVFGEESNGAAISQLNSTQRKVLVSLLLNGTHSFSRTGNQMYEEFEAYCTTARLPVMYKSNFLSEVEILITLNLVECSVADFSKRNDKTKYSMNVGVQAAIDCPRMESVHMPFLQAAKRQQLLANSDESSSI